MSKQAFYNKSFCGMAVAALLVLSGCDMFTCKKKQCGSSACGSSTDANDKSEVLLSIAGKPVITADQFEAYYNQFLAANPRLQGMIQFLPNAKQEIFKGMANEEIVVYWAEQNNICDTDEYKKELEQAVKMVKRGLAAKNFEQAMVGKVSVTEAEMKDYYEKHKNPELIVSPGGIKALGVEFADKAKAQLFFDKVKANPASFKAVADADKAKVREFAPINNFSFDVDKNVKDKVSAVKTFPSVVLVETTEKKFMVVQVVSKEDAKYRSFDEVREGLKSVIEREKMAKSWTEKIDELRSKYDISENATFFEATKPVVSNGSGMPLTQEELEKIVQQTSEAAADQEGA